MQLDQRMLNRLLSLNDDQLAATIQKIAAESGIDPAQLGLSAENVSEIRRVLGSVSDAELTQLNTVYESYRKNRKN